MLTVVLLTCARLACADGIEPPDTTGFRLTGEEDRDGDGDGSRETHVRHYVNATGDRLFSMVTHGRLWAWSRQSGDGSTDADRNYVIIDSNCDGVFDARYTLDEQYHLPACLGPVK